MRVKAGMTRARVSGMKTGAGRRKGEARALLRGGHSEREVARLVGIGKGTIRLRRRAASTVRPKKVRLP